MSYGFRLYTAAHAHETGRLPKLWVDDAFDFGKHVVKVAGELIQKADTSGAWPDPHPAYLNLRDVSSLEGRMSAWMAAGNVVGRVDRVEKLNDHRITITVCIGRVGTHDRALGGRDDPLLDKAAARLHRATLVFPRAGSGKGLLAVETVGRSGPVKEIGTLISLGSRYRSFATKKVWHRLILNQVTDVEFLKEVLAGQEASVVLTRSSLDGAGDRVRQDMRLEAKVHAKQLGGLAGWLGLNVSQRSSAGVRGMMQIVASEELLGDVGFDDGFVKVGNGDSATKVGMADMLDRFTYPVTENVRPTDEAWEQAVRERMQIVDPDLPWD